MFELSSKLNTSNKISVYQKRSKAKTETPTNNIKNTKLRGLWVTVKSLEITAAWIPWGDVKVKNKAHMRTHVGLYTWQGITNCIPMLNAVTPLNWKLEKVVGSPHIFDSRTHSFSCLQLNLQAPLSWIRGFICGRNRLKKNPSQKKKEKGDIFIILYMRQKIHVIN